MGNKPASKNSVAVAASMMHARIAIGPLPSPEELKQYENILPGSAERILSMAERQSEHRQFLEKRDSQDQHLGIVFAFTLALAALVAGCVVVLNGHPILGSLFGLSGVGGIVATFIYGTRSNRKEREQAHKSLNPSQ